MRRRVFAGVALCVLLLTAAACGTGASQSPSASPTPTASPTIPPDAAPTELQGRWNTVLAPGDRAELILGQSAFSINRGGVVGRGHISVHGDQIEFSRVSSCEGTGTYRWTIASDTLTFTPIGPPDKCPRAFVLKDHEFTREGS